MSLFYFEVNILLSFEEFLYKDVESINSWSAKILKNGAHDAWQKN